MERTFTARTGLEAVLRAQSLLTAASLRNLAVLHLPENRLSFVEFQTVRRQEYR